MRLTERRSWCSPGLTAVMALSLAVAAAGCSSSSSETAEAEDHEGHAAEAGATGGVPRVYFAQPQNGATVTSPVMFEFASDQFTISAIPEGQITEADVRPGVGHYHLGIDTDCLPVGEAIPQGNPSWIHFGKGNNTIEQQMSPGPHRLVVQAGDDLHRTMAGLCETINITVAE